MELTDILTKSLGVSQNQAQGGAGLLFKLAKDKLGAGDSSKVASAVPGVERPRGSQQFRTGLCVSLARLSMISGRTRTMTLEYEYAPVTKSIATIRDLPGLTDFAAMGDTLLAAVVQSTTPSLLFMPGRCRRRRHGDRSQPQGCLTAVV